ncbi:MAG: 4Fe-4S dicluster domain-containing protein [Prolixibacteraceae bacterium]|jgi:molybdopterin-containing oxidoreductase family iron-sulfur binding subunit|nr:4Fe-4S dicluster domain-containing protein [Prolixibacteraceae bacterium]
MSNKKSTTDPDNSIKSQDSVDSRRTFFKRFGLVGAAAAAGGAAIYSGYKYEQNKPNHDMVKVLTADNKLVEVPRDQIKDVKFDLTRLQKQGREGLAGRRFVMVIDLAKCRNARKCIQACQSAHQLRPYEYHINTLTMQESENTAPYFMPKPCQHCDNPPCVSVCPVDATFKRQDGIVLIDNERCIGCRFCVAACPYSARMFHWEEPMTVEGDKGKEYNIELNVPQKKGTVSKCLFSADRLREGKLPYCVSSCPNGVYYFGDENQDAVTNGTTKETFRLSELLKTNGGYHLMPELGTKPRVYYLPAKNRLFEGPAANDKV